MCTSLAIELTDHVILVGALGFDLLNREDRFGEGAGIEPAFAFDLLVSLMGACIDLGHVDVQTDFGLLGFEGVEIHLSTELLESSLHGNPHLAVNELNAALVELNRLIGGRLG